MQVNDINSALVILSQIEKQEVNQLSDEQLEMINSLAFVFANVKHESAKRKVIRDSIKIRKEREDFLASCQKEAGDVAAKLNILDQITGQQKNILISCARMYNYAMKKDEKEGMQVYELKIYRELEKHGINDKRVFAHLCNIAEQ